MKRSSTGWAHAHVRPTILVSLMFVATLVLGGMSAAADSTGSITGFVRDNLGGPLSRISVASYPYCSGSSADGSYLITGIPVGTYSVTASDRSWTSISHQVTVVAEETVSCDFTLQLGRIAGVVKSTGGRPLVGATISAQSYGYSATTGQNGEFAIENVGPTYLSSDRTPHYYMSTASGAGYIPLEKRVEVKGGETTLCDFVPTAYGSISGTVTDSTDHPLEGALIALTGSCHNNTGTTDANGCYLVQDIVPAAGMNLTASKTGYGKVAKGINVGEGEQPTRDFKLAAAFSLEQVAQLSVGTTAGGISVQDGLAAIACGSLGVRFVDISSPSNPRIVSTHDTTGSSIDVSFYGHYVVVADSTGVRLLDTSNPEAPSLVGAWDGMTAARGLRLIGDRAYVADGNSGLHILSIADPANPVRLGGYNTPGYASGADVVGNFAYIADGTGLVILDIHDPVQPTSAGAYNPANARIRDVAVSCGYAYIADENLGLQVIDVSNTTNTALIATGGLLPYQRYQRITLHGNYVCVPLSDSGGVAIYDITTPTDPCQVASYISGHGTDVALSDGYAYVSDGYGLLRVLALRHIRLDVVTPRRAFNSDAAFAMSLTGFGFRVGTAVKLARAGQADINATNVSILSAGQMSCQFDLTAAAAGFWDVVVTSAEGESSRISRRLGVMLPDSTRCVATTVRSTRDAATAAACSTWRFRLFGKVISVWTDAFSVDDGTGAPTTVSAPGCTWVHVGDYVAASGTLDTSTTQAVLMSNSTSVDLVK